MLDELNIMVGGEAGQGVQSVGYWLAKAFARGGFHIFADQDYESRIRGGHNFFRLRVSHRRVEAIAEQINIVIALNEESIRLHSSETARNGVIIYDNQINKNVTPDERLFGIPLQSIAEEKGGNKLMENTVALGAAVGLTHLDFELITKIILEQFGGEIGEGNVRAARAGYDFAKLNYHGPFDGNLVIPPASTRKMVINGSEAIAMGALAAGCKFMSAYPMTPTTPILEYMASKSREFNIAVVQPEDEIAAINMSIGAAYAGVRAMTATSGSGFCLMVEGLGLSGITETPIVIIEGQRPGPAVGLPTRTEQGDLQFVLNAHHGEFPRVVFAPSNVEESFQLTVKAFNLAEKYQLPVIVINDHYLATVYSTVERFDTGEIKIERGELYSANTGATGQVASEAYKRHKITPSGISPRAFPGLSRALVVTDADEHDETGHLTEDAKTRNDQVLKRLRKLVSLKEEITIPEIYGHKTAQTTIIGWGSTRGAMMEAIDILRREDKMKINLLHLSELWPFPAEKVSDILKRSRTSYVVENNATGQLARLIRQETGKQVTGTILRFDGRPFTPAGIVKKIREECC